MGRYGEAQRGAHRLETEGGVGRHRENREA